MIPCANCGHHFRAFLDKQYLPNVQDLATKLRMITSSRIELIKFFVEAHNNVTRHTNRTAKLWTVEDAEKYYKYGYRCVPDSIVPWETAALMRGKDGRCGNWVQPSDAQKPPYCKEWLYPSSGPNSEAGLMPTVPHETLKKWQNFP